MLTIDNVAKCEIMELKRYKAKRDYSLQNAVCGKKEMYGGAEHLP